MASKETRFPKLELTRRVKQMDKTYISTATANVLIRKQNECDCSLSTLETSRASFGCDDDELVKNKEQCLSTRSHLDDSFGSQRRQNICGVIIKKKRKLSDKSTQTCKEFSSTSCHLVPLVVVLALISNYFPDVSVVVNEDTKMSSRTEIDLVPGCNVEQHDHDIKFYQEYFKTYERMKDMVQQLQSKIVVVEKQVALFKNSDDYKKEIDEYISIHLWGEEADYALESSGGSVVATPDTNTYNGAHDSVTVTLFGLPVWKVFTSYPRLIIMGSMQPGQCWAFSGDEGKVVIRLASPVQVSGVTIEHFPEHLLPVEEATLSAPRHFAVVGFTNYDDVSDEDRIRINIGSFEYKRGANWRQTFQVHNKVYQDMSPVQFVEFHFQSNHGNPTYTCVYRVRVHG